MEYGSTLRLPSNCTQHDAMVMRHWVRDLRAEVHAGGGAAALLQQPGRAAAAPLQGRGGHHDAGQAGDLRRGDRQRGSSAVKHL